MRYLIGIDGGGTKTLLRAAAADTLAVLGEERGGASNLTALPAETVRENLRVLLDHFFANSGLFREHCLAVVLGSAGAGSPDARRSLERTLREFMPQSRILVTDDALPLIYAGLGTGVGMVLISGTGSICYGRDRAGNGRRSGGWGHLIGDEGSGYALGRDALTAVMEAYDGRGPETLLTRLIFEKLGLGEPMELIDWVYRRGNGKSEIAALSALCEQAALAGDEAALQIFERAAADLARMVKAVASHLPEEDRVLVCSGGNLVKSPLLRQALAQRLPDIRFVLSTRDAADGCLLMAREQATL